MPPLCIVEDRRHPSPGMLALRLAEFEGITVAPSTSFRRN